MVNIIDRISEIATNLLENIEVFFHKEKTYGLAFLLFVVIIILGHKLKK